MYTVPFYVNIDLKKTKMLKTRIMITLMMMKTMTMIATMRRTMMKMIMTMMKKITMKTTNKPMWINQPLGIFPNYMSSEIKTIPSSPISCSPTPRLQSFLSLSLLLQHSSICLPLSPFTPSYLPHSPSPSSVWFPTVYTFITLII